MTINKSKYYDKIVFLLQGGGALGSFQVGVCQALLENGLQPDWVVGTSIGGINSAIIAGNKPEHQVAKLHEFWDAISYPLPNFIGFQDTLTVEIQNFIHAQLIATFGLPNFFRPRFFNPFVTDTTPDKISLYDTSELRSTLEKVIDFDLINQKKIRLTLGSIQIRGGKAVYFDNFHQTIAPEHVMASGALPPGFPAIKIDDEYYWDGGLSSNTPGIVLLKENIPEFEFASRHEQVFHYFCELHFLKNAIDKLTKNTTRTPEIEKILNKIKQIGHPTALDIVRFHYHDLGTNLWSKDYNFSRSAIQEHLKAGYANGKKALKDTSWMKPIEGTIGGMIHDC